MALRSWLLNLEDYHFLFQAQNLADFFKYLETTVYGTALKGWDWQAPDAEAEFNRRLYGELARAFRQVGRGLQKREALFIGRLAGRLEAENLKLVLRALHRGCPPRGPSECSSPLTVYPRSTLLNWSIRGPSRPWWITRPLRPGARR